MRVYLDASSIANLALLDAGWQTLDRWLTQTSPDLHLSDFGWGEFVSAVSLRVRQRLITVDQANMLILQGEAGIAGWNRVEICSADVAKATALVHRFDLKIKLPDAIHLAVSHRLDSLFVTADRRQATAAEAIGLTVFNPLPGDPPA